MRIDRSCLTDAPGGDHTVRRGRSALDGVDTAGRDERTAARGQDKLAEAAAADEPARVGSLDRPAETRSRGEVYADTRQSAESGWDRQRIFDAPRDELARFKTGRAGLPQVSPAEADRHIEQHRFARPWLQVAERASPESRRIIAAIDQGSGHGHIRHEGWVTEEANMRRAAYLEDPAQLDPAKRQRGIDGLKPDDKRHKCAELATRVTDPDAFATAFTRGAEHPRVRAAIAAPYDPGVWPGPVLIPIADLLGKDGHKYCTGWQLEPVDGSMDAAISNRRAWRAAMAEARQPDVPQPAARPVPTFEGGTLLFLIAHNQAQDGYEIVNMYPQPRDDDLPASFASLSIGATMRDFYWDRHPDGPFATLIRIATTYLHPEVDELEALQKLVKRDTDEMRTFKAELRRAIDDPAQLPDDELSKHVRYEDGSPEAFLQRLWRDLYDDEAVDAPE